MNRRQRRANAARLRRAGSFRWIGVLRTGVAGSVAQRTIIVMEPSAPLPEPDATAVIRGQTYKVTGVHPDTHEVELYPWIDDASLAAGRGEVEWRAVQ